jgi:hypothetical protein
MPTPEQNFSFIQAGLEELEEYLLSDVLFWSLPGAARRQRLTPGSLLLAMRSLDGGNAPGVRSADVERLTAGLQVLLDRQRSAWQSKCRREVHARLELWKNYLDDYRLSPEDHADLYPEQVRWRVLLQLLADQVELRPDEDVILAELDNIVKLSWLPGEFLWEPGMAGAFPEPEYWFLYGRLKT